MMKYNLIIYGLFLLAISSCKSQSNKSQLSSIVENEAKLFLTDNRFESVTISIFHKGENFIGHFGELDHNQNNKPTNETLYEIASVTKTMTGYLVACAVNEGKISLDTPVQDILGKEFSNLDYKGDSVLIRHLITHTSGIPLNVNGVSKLYENPNGVNYKKAQGILSKYSKKNLLDEIKSLELTESPGKNYSYSNVAPNLLAFILEEIYAKPYESILKEKLFVPAQMANTFINLDDNHRPLLANGYNGKKEMMPNFNNPINLWGAAGRIKSNSVDMLNYIKWQLDLNNPIIQMSHDKLFHDLENIWIAYFWEVIDDENGSHIEHHGGIYGSQNWIMIYPEYDYGISIITNSSFPEANQLIKRCANNIFKKIK